MNQLIRPQKIGASACPHDCPSTCALEVEIVDAHTIGRVRGAEANKYTAGVICAKVARYAERVHHPDRLLRPLRRKGDKGSGEFSPISWDDALEWLDPRQVWLAPDCGLMTIGRQLAHAKLKVMVEAARRLRAKL